MFEEQAGTLQGDLTTLGKTLSELDATLDLARRRIRDLLGPSAVEEPRTHAHGNRELKQEDARADDAED
jgi:hypothetical protein